MGWQPEAIWAGNLTDTTSSTAKVPTIECFLLFTLVFIVIVYLINCLKGSSQYVCVHACVRVCVHLCMCMHMYACMCLWTLCTHVHVCACVCVCVRACVCVCMLLVVYM